MCYIYIYFFLLIDFSDDEDYDKNTHKTKRKRGKSFMIKKNNKGETQLHQVRFSYIPIMLIQIENFYLQLVNKLNFTGKHIW